MAPKNLIDGRVGVSWVAGVGRPLQDIPQDLVLVGRVSLGVVCDELFQIGNGTRKAWEVKKLAGKKRLSEVADKINKEFLCKFL